jgi:hypothetical protein
LVDPDNTTLASSEANITISVNHQNDAPRAGRAVPPTNGSAHGHATVQASYGVSITDVSVPFILNLTSVDVDQYASRSSSYMPSFAPHQFARIKTFPRGGRLFQVHANGSLGDVLDVTVSRSMVPTVTSWVTEVVRFSSQYSTCRGCYVWSGAQDTGCNQHNPESASTCVGDGCSVGLGEPLQWGDASCAATAWHATQITGPPDAYPSCATDSARASTVSNRV